MDVLSSQANLAGYQAVIDAAAEYDRALPMMMTAAGTVPAAKVFIMGVGVAGLQAIATARRLGAVVTATDVRPAAKEQVASLGAKFLAVEDEEFKAAETAGGYAKEMSKEYQAKQAALTADHIAKQDIVITTALIPGRPAPKLVTAAMVASMKPGSVIVDLAVERGGNVEGAVPAILGTPAGFATITTSLYQDLARSSDPAAFAEAAVLAATLVVLAVLVVGPADRWLTGRTAARTAESAGGAGGSPAAVWRIRPRSPPSKPRRRPRHLREQISGWGMIAPAAVLLLAFVFLPAILGFGLAFTNARLVSPRPVEFVGTDNFARLFADPTFWRSLLNVSYFAVVVVPVQSGIALAMALLINKKFRGVNFFRTVYFPSPW